MWEMRRIEKGAEDVDDMENVEGLEAVKSWVRFGSVWSGSVAQGWFKNKDEYLFSFISSRLRRVSSILLYFSGSEVRITKQIIKYLILIIFLG